MASSDYNNDVTALLQQDYVQSFPEKVKAIKIAKQELLAAEHIDESLKILQNTTHIIVGSSGAYGFEQIRSIAGDIEFLCNQYISIHRQTYHQESIHLIQKYLDKRIMLFQAYM